MKMFIHQHVEEKSDGSCRVRGGKMERLLNCHLVGLITSDCPLDANHKPHVMGFCLLGGSCLVVLLLLF